ncbi:helicase SNF [Anaerobacillus arseniciselenatis]|uniref:Helicase SNF n=1 Tax=Anaerobacillus arseniciselenatis TaxID=85682 RepID=A0A1S2LRW1_9BACI|nr:DEAD/DEAH box helicase [Anaerobacillus arseniciselenatis]OIJ15251.1 helicase SNF [Anaerobacillus arseniciselenatis]
MNIKVTPKLIQDMCGTVSFKKGDSFHRANKVSFEKFEEDHCEAIVTGTEDFYVTVHSTREGGIHAQCSCPKLASFQKDCQHIAAVLLAIYEQQGRGTSPISGGQDSSSNDPALTEGLLTLFNDPPRRKSQQQTYFEKRQVVAVEFVCQPVRVSNDQYMFGLQLKFEQAFVKNIREFLQLVEEGKRSSVSSTYNYDPTKHCFDKNTEAVIRELIRVNKDEKVYSEATSSLENDRMLLIAPSSWERLLRLFENSPLVKLNDGAETYDEFEVANDKLSLHFELVKGNGTGYHLKVHGLKQLIVLADYNSVISEGVIIEMNSEDCQRLSDLIKMMTTSGAEYIPIPKEQIHFFLDKVVPGLKKLGEVKISAVISEGLVNTPLKAKLYLDRVKNRLLAGLEFQYENWVINPLESRASTEGPMSFTSSEPQPLAGSPMIRDVDKEEEILQLMDDSGFAKTDGGYLLHNEELEYEFLSYVVPKLQKLVQIYATTSVKMRIFKGNKPPQIKVKKKKDRTNWLEFKFEMDGIPEQHIREILQALEEKRKFYRLNGSLLPLETKEFEDVQHFLANVPNQYEDLEKGLNVPIVRGLQLLDTVQGSDIFTPEQSFSQFLDHLRNPGSLKFVVPEELKPILRDYQKQGFQWMKTLAHYGFGGILADDMGLGKTLQSITFIVSELQEIRKKKRPVLIVCPSSLTYNWLSEFKKFSPYVRAIIIDGDQKDRIKKLKTITDVDVVITSYPLLRKDISSYEKQSFHSVFFDEAQAFKNPVTQTARAVKKIEADTRFALTGTPVENSLVELWSIFHVVFPELFQGLKEYSYLSKKAISRRTSAFLLRRIKEDVLEELPKKIESMEKVDLFPEQKKLYAAYLAKLKHETLKHLDKDTLKKNKIKILAGLTRLRQICCHPSLFVDGYQGSSAKFEQLMQLINEAKLSGRRVLIFSQFTKMLELIGRQLTGDGEPFFYLDGQTPSEERLEICDRFNRGERDFFLISLKAGGTGLNLTGADTVILYDLWWNPAVEEQAADRAHRIGQTNDVQVIKLVTKGTIEEKINELQEKKRDLIEEIIDPHEERTPKLTDEDIREILMV